MITTLLSGKIVSSPRSGQSSNGNQWCRVTLVCQTHGGRDSETEASVLANVIAFGSEAEKIKRLSKGDSLAAVGSCRPTHWVKDGETRTSLDVVAHQILTPYLLKQKQNSQPNQDKVRARDMHQATARLYGRTDHEYNN